VADDLKPGEGKLPQGLAPEPPPPPPPADRLRKRERVGPPSPPPAHGIANGRANLGPWVLVAALAALALFLGWRAYVYEEEGDPVASAMLAFERQNALVVFASRFEVVAESEYEQSVGPFTVRRVRQAAIIPASVDYRLDLSAMDADDFRWQDATSTLTVTLPRLQTSRPNLDEAEARIFTEGLLNTAGSQQMLAEKNSQIAEEKALAFAKNAEILALARAAAKAAVQQNLAVPLAVAGFDDARIEVRFEGETGA
jgi:hypothetical protein